MLKFAIFSISCSRILSMVSSHPSGSSTQPPRGRSTSSSARRRSRPPRCFGRAASEDSPRCFATGEARGRRRAYVLYVGGAQPACGSAGREGGSVRVGERPEGHPSPGALLPAGAAPRASFVRVRSCASVCLPSPPVRTAGGLAKQTKAQASGHVRPAERGRCRRREPVSA